MLIDISIYLPEALIEYKDLPPSSSKKNECCPPQRIWGGMDANSAWHDHMATGDEKKKMHVWEQESQIDDKFHAYRDKILKMME